MSELTTIARPYAKAAFDLACEKEQLDLWSDMLHFAAEVARNENIQDFWMGCIQQKNSVRFFCLFVAMR